MQVNLSSKVTEFLEYDNVGLTEVHQADFDFLRTRSAQRPLSSGLMGSARTKTIVFAFARSLGSPAIGPQGPDHGTGQPLEIDALPPFTSRVSHQSPGLTRGLTAAEPRSWSIPLRRRPHR